MDEKCITFEESENTARKCEYSQLDWVKSRLRYALGSHNIRSEIRQLMYEVQSEMDYIQEDIRKYEISVYSKKGDQ